MSLKKDVKIKLLVAFTIIIVSIYLALTKPIKLGLDLQGGISIVLEVDIDTVLENNYKQLGKDIEELLKDKEIDVLDVKVDKKRLIVSILDNSKLEEAKKLIFSKFGRIVNVETDKDYLLISYRKEYLENLKKDIVNRTIEVLRRRIDEFGTLNPNIAKLGDKRIIVELPGVVNPDRAKAIIGKTAQLEILEVVDYAMSKEELLAKYPDGLPKGTKIIEGIPKKYGKQSIKEWFLVKDTPIITGDDLKDAQVRLDQYGNPAVDFELKSNSAEKFGEATARLINKRMAIVLDNKVISAPVVRSRISNAGQITGDFTSEEASDLALVLRAGALPAPVEILEERLIGPTLGKDSIQKTINAGIVALTLVGIFMIFRYAISGFISIIALLINGLLLWAILVAFGITLTLPGIAGIILNIGMAVDANVIIFERIREELGKGKTLRVSLEEGFKRAWDAILDAQITTLIAAFVLFQFGTGPLKGFAATLSIGTITSIFTAMFITKLLLDVIVGDKKSMKYAI